MRGISIFFLLSLAVLACAQQNETGLIPPLPAADIEMSLAVKDAGTLSLFPDRIVRLVFFGASGTITSVRLLPNDSIARVSLDAGDWTAFGEIDDPSTPGSDYAGRIRLAVSKPAAADLLLQQAGSASGFVYDEANRSVAGARLSLECGCSFCDMDAFADMNNCSNSNEYGAFSMRFIPAGTSCRLFASSGERIGFIEFSVKRGEKKNLRINLTGEKAVSESILSPFLIAIIGVILAAVLAFVFFLKRNKRVSTNSSFASPKSSSQRHSAAKLSNRNDKPGIALTRKMRDVIATLPQGERRVVEHLLENNGRSRHSKIFYALLIPKTTLSRLLFSLENKKIINTRKFGKIRQVELSEWFLSEK
ncbi:MAG: hypothetical protein V1708_02235 [Candidatus Micrarchaeota archaeon]